MVAERKNFFKKLRDENENFLIHIIGHGIKIFSTMVLLKLIYIVSNLIFSEEPPVVKYMESLSSWGMLAIFTILVIFDIYDTACISRQKRRNIYE